MAALSDPAATFATSAIALPFSQPATRSVTITARSSTAWCISVPSDPSEQATWARTATCPLLPLRDPGHTSHRSPAPRSTQAGMARGSIRMHGGSGPDGVEQPREELGATAIRAPSPVTDAPGLRQEQGRVPVQARQPAHPVGPAGSSKRSSEPFEVRDERPDVADRWGPAARELRHLGRSTAAEPRGELDQGVLPRVCPPCRIGSERRHRPEGRMETVRGPGWRRCATGPRPTPAPDLVTGADARAPVGEHGDVLEQGRGEPGAPPFGPLHERDAPDVRGALEQLLHAVPRKAPTYWADDGADQRTQHVLGTGRTTGRPPTLHSSGQECQALQDRRDLDRQPRTRSANQRRRRSGTRIRGSCPGVVGEPSSKLRSLHPHVRALPRRARFMRRVRRLPRLGPDAQGVARHKRGSDAATDSGGGWLRHVSHRAATTRMGP